MCGRMSSSQPVITTTGNSSPLAVWMVIRRTTPSSSSIVSGSATRATCSRNWSSVPPAVASSKPRGGVDQFGHVLVARAGGFRVIALPGIPRTRCPSIDPSTGSHGRARRPGHHPPPRHHVEKPRTRLQAAGAISVLQQPGAGRGLPQGQLLAAAASVDQAVHRGVADLPLGHVDHALGGDHVARDWPPASGRPSGRAPRGGRRSGGCRRSGRAARRGAGHPPARGDWALVRYSTVDVVRASPAAVSARTMSTSRAASSSSSKNSSSVSLSPWPPLVHRFLPLRCLLWAMTALAAARMLPVLR